MEKHEAFQVPTAWGGARASVQEAMNKVHQNGGINVIVEIGIDFGYSLFHFAEWFPNALVFGIDCYDSNHPSRIEFEKRLPLFNNIRFLNAFSVDAGRRWKHPETFLTIDVLHIDGDHSYVSVKQDYEAWKDYVRPGGIIVFHDTRSNPDSVGKFFSELDGEKEEHDAGGPGIGILWV